MVVSYPTSELPEIRGIFFPNNPTPNDLPPNNLQELQELEVNNGEPEQSYHMPYQFPMGAD